MRPAASGVVMPPFDQVADLVSIVLATNFLSGSK